MSHTSSRLAKTPVATRKVQRARWRRLVRLRRGHRAKVRSGGQSSATPNRQRRNARIQPAASVGRVATRWKYLGSATPRSVLGSEFAAKTQREMAMCMKLLWLHVMPFSKSKQHPLSHATPAPFVVFLGGRGGRRPSNMSRTDKCSMPRCRIKRPHLRRIKPKMSLLSL